MGTKDWDELEHPRDDIGRFTLKDSASSNSSKEEKNKEIIRKINDEKAKKSILQIFCIQQWKIKIRI